MRVSKPGQIFLVVSLLLAITGPATGGDAGRESPFTVGVGARALGMGGAFTSLADDAAAVFYNPAGLATVEYQEVSFMHMTLLEESSFNFAGLVYPHPWLGGFGAAWLRLGTDDIIRRSDFLDMGRFDYVTSQFLLSYGRVVNDDASIGLSFKVMHQSLADFSDYGIGLDLGGRARLYRDLYCGLLIRDLIPPRLDLDGASESIPQSVVGGLSWHRFSVSERLTVTPILEVEKIEDRSVKLHAGVEGVLDGAYALRVGYDRDNLSFGTGLTRRGFKIDYAYKIMDVIDDSHRISFSYFFGEPLSVQKQRRRQAVPSTTEVIEAQQRREFVRYREKAEVSFEANDLDSALVYYQWALAFDPDNEAILSSIAAIENRLRLERQQQIERQLQVDMTLDAELYYTQAQKFHDR
ncbi:MAG: PorV/PorQ family protein, partial [Candidatus Zixiibacteriota bacterium]